MNAWLPQASYPVVTLLTPLPCELSSLGAVASHPSGKPLDIRQRGTRVINLKQIVASRTVTFAALRSVKHFST